MSDYPGASWAYIHANYLARRWGIPRKEIMEHIPVLERIFIPAENHQIELEDAVRAVDELSALLGTITSTTMRSRLTEQLRALDLRITELENLPTTQAGWEYVQTNQTYAHQWAENNTEQRRQLLLRSGITATVLYDGALTFHLRIPEEVHNKMAQKKSPTQC